MHSYIHRTIIFFFFILILKLESWGSIFVVDFEPGIKTSRYHLQYPD